MVVVAAIVGSVPQAFGQWCEGSRACWSCDPCCGWGHSPWPFGRANVWWSGPTCGRCCWGCGCYASSCCGDCCDCCGCVACGLSDLNWPDGCCDTLVDTPMSSTPVQSGSGSGSSVIPPAPPSAPMKAEPTVAPGTTPPVAPPPSSDKRAAVSRSILEPPTPSELPTEANSGLLTIIVPPEAKVFINGQQTRSTASQRQYVSFGLERGKTYPYTISVLVPTKPQAATGQSAEGTSAQQRQEAFAGVWTSRTVYLKAGNRLDVTFPDGMTANRGLAAIQER